jgi:hypothetical protein
MISVEHVFYGLAIIFLCFGSMRFSGQIKKVNQRLDCLTVELDYLEKSLDQESRPKPEECYEVTPSSYEQ